MVASDKGQRASGYKVSSKQNNVDVDRVQASDRSFQEVGFRVLIEMDVADLRNAHSVEGVGQGVNGDRSVRELELVSSDFSAVECQACSEDSGTHQEIAPRESSTGRNSLLNHIAMIRVAPRAREVGCFSRMGFMSFSARRRRVLARLRQAELAALLVTSQPDLRYLCGFTGSAGALVLQAGRSRFFTDGRYAEQARSEVDGMVVQVERRAAAPAATEWLNTRGVRRCGIEATQTTLAELDDLRKLLPSQYRRTFFVPVRNLVSSLRAVKDQEETDALRRAAAIGDQLFLELLGELAPGWTEQRVADRLLLRAKAMGAQGMSFETIVAAGARSALPHGRATHAKLPRRGFVTLDFGVIYNGYCSDMTRTIHLGPADRVASDVYHSVLEAETRALRAAQPGTRADLVDGAARDVLAAAGLAEHFLHATGHGVGLEIHEGPRIGMRSTEVLAEGMVVTIEPGVYLPRRFGIRIEDMLLVTSRGGEILTKSPRALIEL